MEPVLVSCDGCGTRIRITRPDVGRDRSCPRCGTALVCVVPDGSDRSPSEPFPCGGFEADEESVGRPVRLAVEAGLLLALFTALLFQVGGGPVLRASAGTAVPLSASDTHPDHRVTTPSLASSPGRLRARPRSEPAVAPEPARIGPPRPSLPPLLSLLSADSTPSVPPISPSNPEPPTTEPIAPAPASTRETIGTSKRIRVRTRSGRTVVTRVLGESDGEVHVMLPDGRLGVPDRLAYSDEPFVPATADEMAEDLVSGPFAAFKLHRTAHYLLAYQSTDEFAEESGRVLENLYKGLIDAFRKFDVPVHDSEFPLAAVIFRTERDFRAHRPVAPEIQAYYEIDSNRIYFYQTSDRDDQTPEVAAVRRPQTVAHEGTHQILANIGIQPRLAPWPPWLIEGLAEYCATPVTTRRGTNWAGLGMVNSLHLATIRDLDDPLSGQVSGTTRPEHIGRKPGMPLVEYLVRKTELKPTDYALSWAMTHYLARKRVDEFVEFLRLMSNLPPLQKRTPDDHLNAFRHAFGKDLVKLDREIGVYLSKLKVTNHLPYYAVMFQQRIGVMDKRAAIVSQSPSLIRQWLDTVTSPRGDPPIWQAVPYPNRTPALATAEDWARGH